MDTRDYFNQHWFPFSWNSIKACVKFEFYDWHVFLIFPFRILKQLKPSCSKYREGEEYCVLHHIQNGSYGDVFCVRDKSTGFRCAAKRVSQETMSRSLRNLDSTLGVWSPEISLKMFSADLRFHWVISAERRWARGALWTPLVSWSSLASWWRGRTSCSSWTWSQVR